MPEEALGPGHPHVSHREQGISSEAQTSAEPTLDFKKLESCPVAQAEGRPSDLLPRTAHSRVGLKPTQQQPQWLDLNPRSRQVPDAQSKNETEDGPCFAGPWPRLVARAAGPSTRPDASLVTGTWSLGASQRRGRMSAWQPPPHCCPAKDVDPLGRVARG